MRHSVSTAAYRQREQGREQGPVQAHGSGAHVTGCCTDGLQGNMSTNSVYLKGRHGLSRQAVQYSGPSPLSRPHVQASAHGFTGSHSRDGFTDLKTAPKGGQGVKPDDCGHFGVQAQQYMGGHFTGPSSRHVGQQQQQQQQYPDGACEDVPRPHRFPPGFDPRGTPNMSHREKVDKWLSDVPMYLTTVTNHSQFAKLGNEVESSSGTTGCVSIWRNECYQGIVETSSTVSNDNGNLSTSLDEDMRYEYDDQSYCWPLVMNDNSSFNIGTSVGLLCTGLKFGLFVDHDDVLEYQSRKITRYVKKLYRQDHSETVMKLNQVSMEYTGNETGRSQSNMPLNESATGVYLTHDDMDEDEYYDLCNVNPMTIPALPRRKRRYL